MKHINAIEQDQALRNFLIGKPFDPDALSYALEAQTEKALQDAKESEEANLCGVQEELNELQQELDEANQEVEELKDALRPFGELSQEHQENKLDDEPIFAVQGKAITYGDIRKAKELAQ